MSFRIEIQQPPAHFHCEPGQTVLDAAIKAGVPLSYGCRNGQCGSCRGRILTGQVRYPGGTPAGLDQQQAANGDALLCKAVPECDLKISATVAQVPDDLEIRKMPARVKSIDYLSDDVIRMMLQLPAAETFKFLAGQWIYVLLKDGRKRAFSLASAPTDNNRELELHIRHAVGGVFTDFVFEQLQQGALLRIEGPQGTFCYQPDDRPLLMVAGGTGLAPIKGILEQLFQQPSMPPVHLFWGVRALKDLYLNDLLEQWVDQYGLSYTPVLSEPLVEDKWDGETGFVHDVVQRLYPNLDKASAYMAGPPQMIQACKASFTQAGLAEEYLFYDSFEYSSDALEKMQQS